MALPVAVESLCEWFVLGLREALPAEDVAAALGPNLPPGLPLDRVELLPFGRPAMQAATETFCLELRGEAQRFKGLWFDFLERTELVIARKSKRGTKPFDIRPLVAEVRDLGDNGLELRLDWSTGYLSPLTLVRTVMPEAGPTDFRLTKTAQDFPAGAATSTETER